MFSSTVSKGDKGFPDIFPTESVDSGSEIMGGVENV